MKKLKLLAFVLAITVAFTGIQFGTESAYAASKTPGQVKGITLERYDGDHNARLKWRPAENATSYKVYYRRTGTSTWKTKTVEDTYAYLKLKTGVKYKVKVKAYCGSKGGRASEIKTVKLLKKLATPKKIKLEKKISGKKTAMIRWKAVKRASKYKVYYKKNAAAKWKRKTVYHNYTRMSFTPGVKYNIKIKALGKNSESAVSKIKTVKVRKLGIKRMKRSGHVYEVTNPGKGRYYTTWSSSDTGVLKVKRDRTDHGIVTLTAVAPGKATLTVRNGREKKVISFKVVEEQRKVETKAAWSERGELLEAAWSEQVLVKDAWDETYEEEIWEEREVCRCGLDVTDMLELDKAAIEAYTGQPFDPQEGADVPEEVYPENGFYHHAFYDCPYGGNTRNIDVLMGTETKTIHHDAEYKTVNHPAVYEIIHHDAEYEYIDELVIYRN